VLEEPLKVGALVSAHPARRMVDAGKGGVIINIQSTTTQKVPAPGLSHHVASKGGIEALTKSLAVEF
jgi:NAD(P)-dependent dehydrogenase (short-subunit alcohol dehydrogenase family)